MKISLWMAIALMVLDTVSAGVERVEISEHRTVSVPGAGAYEDVRGTVHFRFDPANRYNSRIVDLDKLPVDDSGLVEASADFRVLRPASGASRALWLEVSNRGGQASLRYFNGAGTQSPFGDGLLMRLGLTVAWVGWQWDVPRRDGVLRLTVPVATDNGDPITGLVRSDWTVDQPAESLVLGHRNHIHYPVADPADSSNVLTVRDGRSSPRREVPRSDWHFTDDSIVLEGGFQAGRIYELVYRGRDPRPVGLGLAALRDIASHARKDSSSIFAAPHAVAFGVSQTGRFLRHFLYQGFNTDESGEQAFDGLLIHTAGGGRGSFNHRFGQASRDAHRYSAFFFPTDLFPFTGREQVDPLTGRRDGLLSHAFNASHIPKIFYTNTGYEYWGRAASLLHTSVDGRRDIEPLPSVRIYHLAGAQHSPGRFPPDERARLTPPWTYRNNTLNFLVTMRALAGNLLEWVVDNRPPPPSAFPRIADGSLVAIDQLRVPPIPALAVPRVIHTAYRADYGPRWSRGIVDRQPPDLGPEFPSLVSQLDALGNEIAGVRAVELRAALATYFPWNLRHGRTGSPEELTDFTGTFAPLPANQRQKQERGDPRPSIEELYGSRQAYVEQARQAAGDLVRERLLREEDVETVVQRAAALWDWIQAQ